MMSARHWVLALVAALAPSGCAARRQPAADASEQSHRATFVKHIEELFGTAYAMSEHKKARLGWNLDHELETLRLILDDRRLDAQQFRHALHKFFRSPADVHTSIAFESPRAVWLGVHLRRTESGYRVAWVDRSVASSAQAAPEVGDEVILFDGEVPSTVIALTRAQTGWRSTPAFEQTFAEWFTTFRVENEWPSIPEPGDAVTLLLRRRGKLHSIRLPWRDANAEPDPPPSRRCPFWGKSMEGYLPDLGTVVWRNSDIHHVAADVFEAGGHTFGRLRIHSYGAHGADALTMISEFDRAVDAFIARGVEGIVIDQLGNMGGDYSLGLTMLARLSNQPLRPPTQRFAIDARGKLIGFPRPEGYHELVRSLEAAEKQTEIARAFESNPILSDDLAFLPRSLETARDLRDFLRFIHAERQPRSGLSEPHFEVLSEYRSDPARGATYTGPLLLLIDELNISAAEYVAAALADNGRAKLFGTVTAGAGGDQRWYLPSNVCGTPISDPTAPCVPGPVSSAMRRLKIRGFTLTVTLGLRVSRDGSTLGPIENVGVRPSVPYTVTSEDLLTDFRPMRFAIRQALVGLIDRDSK